MSRLDPLLVVQDLDTRLDQLEHRRTHLPEDEQLAEIDGSISAVAGRRAEIEVDHHALAREQHRIEDEVAGIEARVSADNDRLYDGSITSPKEAGALQDEIASLKRRQAGLEDEVLELMEQIEPITQTLAKFDATAMELDERRGRIDAARTVALAELSAERADVERQRDEAAGGVEADLLERYTSLRSRSRNGIAIARIDAGRCTSCALGLSAVFLDRAKAAGDDEIHQCEECGVLLAWSGTTE